MRAMSDALPLTHIVGGLRHAWLGTTDGSSSLWWPALLATIAVLVAVRTAKRGAD